MAESVCFNVIVLPENKKESIRRYWHSIFSRHQQVIPGHKCAATVGETDGWIRHGERIEGGGGRKLVGWQYNFNPFADRTRYNLWF